MTRHKNETDDTVELARQLHESGLGYKLISRKLEVPISTVRDWVTYRVR